MLNLMANAIQQSAFEKQLAEKDKEIAGLKDKNKELQEDLDLYEGKYQNEMEQEETNERTIRDLMTKLENA